MALAHSAAVNELQILRDDLLGVPQVRQVFAQADSKHLAALIVLDEYDRVAEKKILKIEADLIDAFPWFDVDFDVVYLGGRPVAEVVSPKGFQLFAR